MYPGELLRELPREEFLGTGRSPHPQRDRSQVRLEEELEGKEAAALPLFGDEARQSLDPLLTPAKDELVAVLELPHVLACAKELARDIVLARALYSLRELAGDGQPLRRTSRLGTHGLYLLKIGGCPCALTARG